MNDGIADAVLRDMLQRADARRVAQWLRALGLRAAADDLQRRDEIELCRRLFDAGATRSEVFARMAGRGLSKATINRRIAEALAQRRPPLEPVRRHDAGIET